MASLVRSVVLFTLLTIFSAGCGSAAQSVAPVDVDESIGEPVSLDETAAVDTTTTQPSASSTTSNPTVAETTVPDAMSFEDTLREELDRAGEEFTEEFSVEIDDSLPRDEQIALLLQGVGERTLTETSEGRCIVEAFNELSDESLVELKELGSPPSVETVTAVGVASRSCGIQKNHAANMMGGLLASGGTEDWLSHECLLTTMNDSDEVAVFLLTGNHGSLDIPPSIPTDNPVLLMYAVMGPCMNYGHVVDDGLPVALSESSLGCVNEWGKVESRLLRLFAGDMDEVEFFGAMQGCLTPEEFNSWGT